MPDPSWTISLLNLLGRPATPLQAFLLLTGSGAASWFYGIHAAAMLCWAVALVISWSVVRQYYPGPDPPRLGD